MKRSTLLRHFRFHGCYLKREGGSHSLWCNPANGVVEAVPRHTEISNRLAIKISAIVMEPHDVAVLERSRGYADLEPELAWEQWQIVRDAI